MRSPTQEPIMMMRPLSFMCFSARQRGGEHAADVDVDHAIQLFERAVLRTSSEWPCRHCSQAHPAGPKAATAFSTAAFTASASAASAWMAIAFPPPSSIALTTAEADLASGRVGYGDAGPIRSETFCDSCADTTRTTSNERHFILQVRHKTPPLVAVNGMRLENPRRKNYSFQLNGK